MNTKRMLFILFITLCVAQALAACGTAVPTAPASEPTTALPVSTAESLVAATAEPAIIVKMTDPAAVARDFYKALNAGNIETAMALVSEDVKCRGACYLNGKTSFRSFMQGGINMGGRVELNDLQVDGDKVSYNWTAYNTDDVPVALGTESLQIQNGLIILMETRSGSAPVEPAEKPALEFVRSIVGSPNPLSQPVAVALDSQDNLYVLEAGSGRVQVFDPNGQFLRTWGSPGNGDGQFNLRHPNPPSLEGYEGIDAYGDITVDAAGDVYVLDSFNRRVQKFSSDGRFLGAWGTEAITGTTPDGGFKYPAGIAIDLNGNVFVDDGGLLNVQKFDLGGQFLAKFGEQGLGDHQFSGILGSLAIGDQGQVYVSNFWDNRVQVFDENGQLVNAGKFLSPWGITLDAEGNVYVTQSTEDSIAKFDPQGAMLFKWGERGGADGQFRQPMGLTIDSQGLIYVAEYGNNRVQVFRQP
jgi:DNA-binding beta-propeller fold protein YncE